MELNCAFGIDFSKRSLDLADYPNSMTARFDNDPDSHQQLLAKLPPADGCLLVLEATGGYEKAIVLALLEAGYVVSVVNPRQVRDFARAVGVLAKTEMPLTAGTWKITTVTDDGIRVKVNGKTVIDNWTWHAQATDTASFELPRDQNVTIEVAYFELNGGATLSVKLEPVGEAQ